MSITSEMLKKEEVAKINTLEELRVLVKRIFKQAIFPRKTSEAEWEFFENMEQLDYTLEFYPELYKQDLKLFKEVVRHYYVYLTVDKVFKYCSDILESLPDLHKALTNYVNSQDDVRKALV